MTLNISNLTEFLFVDYSPTTEPGTSTVLFSYLHYILNLYPRGS